MSDASPVISFRPLHVDDMPRLIAWLAAPHVSAWWHPTTPAEIKAKYLPRIRGETNVSVYAILLDAEPVGLVQAAPDDTDERVCNVDLLIGDVARIGSGIGPAIINAFVTNEVFGRLDFGICHADPDEANQRSIRAFEKAGFTRLRAIEVDHKVHSLMTRRRAF